MKPHSFTIRYGSGKTYSLISAVTVLPLSDSNPADEERIVHCNAIWDAGASITCVSQRVARKLSLELFPEMNARAGSGLCLCPPCIIGLILSNGIRLDGVAALATNLNENDFDVIIGLDVISKGDFAVISSGGETIFSYRYPSMQVIDFEHYEYIETAKTTPLHD
ncbi:MAG: hypothetical protein LBS11_02765 [Oscillospiraceae bacterium]|jgi:hypothetical protein|nr:hypothetical protein [Oscillospiraceae bacterium]